MEELIELSNNLIDNIKAVETAFTETNNQYKAKEDSNIDEITKLNLNVASLNDEIINFDNQLRDVQEDYDKVNAHIDGIKAVSEEHKLLGPDKLEAMLNDAASKRDEVAAVINSDKAKTAEEMAKLKEQMTILRDENLALEELFPKLQDNYSNVINQTNEAINRINSDLITYKEELNKIELETVKEDLIEDLEEPLQDDLGAEALIVSQEKIASQEEPVEILEAAEELEEPLVEADTEEAKNLDEAEIEEIKLESEQIENQKTLEIETQTEENYKKMPRFNEVDEENVRVVEREVEAEPIVDYSMNQYVGLDKMNLSEGQKNNLMRNMSSEKFIQLKNVLAEYEIPLTDVSNYYDEFLVLDNIKNLEETLSTFKGIGKDNKEKDFSSMLDVIFTNDNNVLQDNLLTVYSRGENPKHISIQKLSSPYYSSFEERAKEAGQDPEYLNKVHPITTMNLPIAKVVEFDKREKVLERIA